MPTTNWRALRVSSNMRWAIYDETFPAQLDAALAEYPDVIGDFDQDAAVDVLLAITSAWPSLGFRPSPSVRVGTGRAVGGSWLRSGYGRVSSRLASRS